MKDNTPSNCKASPTDTQEHQESAKGASLSKEKACPTLPKNSGESKEAVSAESTAAATVDLALAVNGSRAVPVIPERIF